MKDVRLLARNQATFGDVAVDGLIAGVGAGILMAAYLVASGVVLGEGPGAVLSRFDPAAQPLPQVGILMHLAVSAMYGILFGLSERVILRDRLTAIRSTGLGLLYGLALFVLAEVVLLPGTGSHLAAISPVHFGVAHAIYGISLGFLSRNQRSEERAAK
jgi:hypothetical protein